METSLQSESKQEVDSAERCLDLQSFPSFAPLLEACEDYAQHTGCRFVHGALQDFESEELYEDQGSYQACRTEDGRDHIKLEVMKKAAPMVIQFKERLLLPDSDLQETVARAYRLVMTESVRNGIVATCRELDLWPPPPALSVPDDDCAFEDTSAPLALIAQRCYNDELRRGKEEALQPLLKRATTASFIVDFATEVGAEMPALSELHQQMLQEFMSRVDEFVGGHSFQVESSSSLGARARQAFLEGIGPGGAAEGLRRQVKVRWSKNWDTTGGTMLNIAMVGLAMAASAATLHRVARRGPR